MAPAIPIIMIGLALASTAFGVVSSIQQASAQSKASEYNAEVATNNAQASRDQAGFEAMQKRTQIYRALSSQKSSAAKSGIQLDGTYDDVAFDSAIESQKDLLAIKYRGDIEANRYMGEAGLNMMEAKNARSQGTFNAVGSIIGGASNVFGMGMKMYGGAKPKVTG